MPGLHDLTHTGYAVVAAPPVDWDAVAKRYAGWAEDAGWAFVRVSARPGVVLLGRRR